MRGRADCGGNIKTPGSTERRQRNRSRRPRLDQEQGSEACTLAESDTLG